MLVTALLVAGPERSGGPPGAVEDVLGHEPLFGQSLAEGSVVSFVAPLLDTCVPLQSSELLGTQRVRAPTLEGRSRVVKPELVLNQATLEAETDSSRVASRRVWVRERLRSGAAAVRDLLAGGHAKGLVVEDDELGLLVNAAVPIFSSVVIDHSHVASRVHVPLCVLSQLRCEPVRCSPRPRCRRTSCLDLLQRHWLVLALRLDQLELYLLIAAVVGADLVEEVVASCTFVADARIVRILLRDRHLRRLLALVQQMDALAAHVLRPLGPWPVRALVLDVVLVVLFGKAIDSDWLPGPGFARMLRRWAVERQGVDAESALW